MGAGTLAWACLLLLGQVPADNTVYTNQLNHRIDVQFKVQRNEIRELRLYASANQGKSWDLVDSIAPEKDFFVFRAPGDGSYWLRVASVNHKGEQFPDNPGNEKPNQKMVIDTIKPIMRSLQARRQGNEVVVNWELQEENPDGNSFRLEYQAKDAGSGLWTAIQATPAQTGQARFTVNSSQALQVRLSLRDLAGNQSFRVADVPGDGGGVARASFNPMEPTNNGLPAVSSPPPPSSPMTSPMSTPMQPVEIANTLTVPGPGASPPPPTVTQSSPVVPSTPAVQPLLSPVSTSAPAPSPPVITPMTAPAPVMTQPGPSSAPPPAPATENRQVIADSRWQPRQDTPAPTPVVAPTRPAEPKLAPPQPPSRPLPPLHYINQPEFLVDYEVSKIGPSGVGSVELYRTHDEGRTWEKYAYDATAGGPTTQKTRLQRLVQFQEGEPDGIYGFTLIVKNRANIGHRPPQNGDLPELRIELDTTPPVAELYAPAPEPQLGNLVMRWKASDKNLTKTPIALEWSERRTGPWQPIGVDLPNSGEFVWKLPERMPVEVFLRLRVRDLAGNETVAITPNSLAVDLNEPEGHLLKVSVPTRQP